MNRDSPHDPLIVALDFGTAAQARALVDALGAHASFYKIGLELFAAGGLPFARELMERGLKVFLDLKFYDIGETVKRATAQIAESGASLLTVHANASVMRAAVEGRGASALELLGVTVLTSWGEQDLVDEGYAHGVQELVARRVGKAREAGMNGVVSSALEAASIRSAAGPDFLIVTPGVRSAGAAVGDQKRVATPAEALRAGASYLVIGRQVTRAADPLAALLAIRAEIPE